MNQISWKEWLIAVAVIFGCAMQANGQLLPVRGQTTEARFRTVSLATDLPTLQETVNGALVNAVLREGEKVKVLRANSSQSIEDGADMELVYSSVIGGTVDNIFVFDAPGTGSERFIAVDRSEVNLLKAGAVGDGSTNDSARLLAALQKGKPIIVPKGFTFRIGTAITYTGNVEMSGGGTIQCSVSGGAGLGTISITGDADIRGIKFIGQSGVPIEGPLYVSVGTARINECVFQDFDSTTFFRGINCDSAKIVEIEACRFLNLTALANGTEGDANGVVTAIRLNGVTELGTISSCHFENIDNRNAGLTRVWEDADAILISATSGKQHYVCENCEFMDIGKRAMKVIGVIGTNATFRDNMVSSSWVETTDTVGTPGNGMYSAVSLYGGSAVIDNVQTTGGVIGFFCDTDDPLAVGQGKVTITNCNHSAETQKYANTSPTRFLLANNNCVARINVSNCKSSGSSYGVDCVSATKLGVFNNHFTTHFQGAITYGAPSKIVGNIFEQDTSLSIEGTTIGILMADGMSQVDIIGNTFKGVGNGVYLLDQTAATFRLSVCDNVYDACYGAVESVQAGTDEIIRNVTFRGNKSSVSTVIPNAATSVVVASNERLYFANAGATTVTNFTGGFAGQSIELHMDGFTTVANNSGVRLASGANFLGADGDVLTLRREQGRWVEVSRGTAAVAGSPLRTVDTVALLASQTSLVDGEAVILNRYSTTHVAGDGSGQLLRYSATAGGTVDNGFIFATPLGGTTRFIAAEQEAVNAKQFGAVGDGSTDDTVRLQACIDMASTRNIPLVLPQGTYLVAKTASPWCLQTKSNVTIRGDGIGKSIIKLANGATADNSRIFYSSSTVTRFSLQNLTVDGNKANYAGTVTNEQNHGFICLPGSSALLFKDAEFKNCKGDGLYCPSTGTTIDGCEFRGNFRIGLHVSKCSELIAINNLIDDTSIGIKVELDAGDINEIMKNIQISNNNIQALEGILLNESGQSGSEFRNVVISNNTIQILTHLYATADYFQTPTPVGVNRGKGNVGPGIFISGVKNGTISGNQIYNSSDYYAIHLARDNSAVVVSGNTIKNQSQDTGSNSFKGAISLGFVALPGQNKDITISNNILDTVLHGISISNPTGGTSTDRISIIGNRIRNLTLNYHALDLHNLQNSQIIGNFVDTQQTTTCVRLRSTLVAPDNIEIIGNTFKNEGPSGVFWFEGENGNATNIRLVGNRNLSVSSPWVFQTQPGGLLVAEGNTPIYPVPFVALTNSATPSVASLTNVTTGGTTAITNFTSGVDGQVITVKILSTHSITNGATIATASATNLAGPCVGTFALDGSVWRQTGDDLGSHTATKNLAMATFNLTGFGSLDGSVFDVDSNGRITQLDGEAITYAAGTGSPEGVLTAAVGSIFTRTNGAGGTTLYVKESGAGNTGWTPIASGAADNLGNHTATTTLAMTNNRISTLHLGTNASPSMTFNSDADTGIYSPVANQVAISAGGTETIRSEVSKNFIHNAMVHEFAGEITPDGANDIDVTDKSFIRLATGAQTVDRFLNGNEGQVLYILLESDDTIVDSTAFIQLSGGVNFTPPSSAAILLIMHGTVWYEVSRTLH